MTLPLFFRLVMTVLLLGLVTLLTLWLHDHPGNLSLDWMGYRIEMPFALAFAGVAVLTVFTALIAYGLVKLTHLPLRYRLARARAQQGKALDAVTYALTSLAVADQGGALKYASQAERLLGDHALVELVRAHVARQRGNQPEARLRLENMLAHPTTRMLASSALAGLARREDRLTEATEHAETAYRLLPNHLPSMLRLFDLYLLQGNWAEAGIVLSTAKKQGALPKDEAKHYEAIRLHLEAQAASREGEILTASLLEQKAHKQSPAFLPATLAAAEGLLARDQWRDGLRVLARGWKAAPHPDLTQLFLAASNGQSDKLREKRLEQMVKAHLTHPESELARARLFLQIGQWEKARFHATTAQESLNEARISRLLTEIERSGGNEAAAVRWRERVADAAPDQAWHCDACHVPAKGWSLHCPSCDAFDTLHWTSRQSASIAIPDDFALPFDVARL